MFVAVAFEVTVTVPDPWVTLRPFVPASVTASVWELRLLTTTPEEILGAVTALSARRAVPTPPVVTLWKYPCTSATMWAALLFALIVMSWVQVAAEGLQIATESPLAMLTPAV